MGQHIITLDSVRKNRNAQEWRNVGRAMCGPFESVGDGENIRHVARQMIESGLSGEVEVWRGGTLVFAAAPLEKWAEGKVGKAKQPKQFRRTGAA